ncbi:MAG: hypothetical protein J7M14_05690, partial [Planctomycetes bacterium]|nr:hypothetical protein [Planctomycetota bacterium]
GYAEKLVRSVQDFSRHLGEHKLDQPLFISYFNNKHTYKNPKTVEGVNSRRDSMDGTAWWLLDEPANWSDYIALKWYGSMIVNNSVAGGEKILWNMDVSRPQWDRGIFDGIRDVIRTSSAFYDFPRIVNRWRLDGTTIINYGSGNFPDVRPLGDIAWSWHVWCGGGDGILPWSSTPMEGYSNMGWLDKPDKLAIIVPIREEGRWSRASIRLKAHRRAQQDMEMCNMLVDRGYGRAYLAGILNRKVGEVESKAAGAEDDAAELALTHLTSARLESVRRALREAIK